MQSSESSLVETDAACAWAYWFEWRGPLELVVRIARAAREAAGQGSGGEPPCRITLHVVGDVEVFRSPEELEAHATRSGLRAFDALAMALGEVDHRITILFAKRGRPFSGLWSDQWLPRGVLVLVAGLSEDAHADACAKREAVASAVRRGAEGRRPALRGETWEGLLPEELIKEELRRRRRTSARERLVGAFLTAASALLFLIFLAERGHEFIVRKVPSGTSDYDYGIGKLSAFLLLIVSVLVGSLLPPIAKWITNVVLPAVAIREHGAAAVRAVRYVSNEKVLPAITGAALTWVWAVVRGFIE